jgi:hypothetical protein
VGWQWSGGNVRGCVAALCTFAPGWRCRQPGSPGTYDFEGPVPIPGPDGTVFTLAGLSQGWAAVPRGGSSVQCWCANAPGTYANESFACVAEACPYPARCVARGEPGNGTACVSGAEGVACARCSRRWYRFRDECRPCPSGVPSSMVLLAVLAGAFVIFVGPALAQLASPAATALLRNIVLFSPTLVMPAHSNDACYAPRVVNVS